MHDPYLYDDAPVLKNLLHIKDAKALEQAEADITYLRLYTVDGAVADLPFDFSRLCAIHKHVFGDIFAWAGEPRTVPIVKGERILGGDSIRYSQPADIRHDCEAALDALHTVDWPALGIRETAETFARLIAALWQVHPFREGNTRSVMTFAAQFAEAHGFRMDKTLLKENAAHVRDALAKASDGQYAEGGYLSKICEDAIRRG
jgi:cell filamentation protein